MLNKKEDFQDKIKRAGIFDALACMNCGSCTALCPAVVEIIPRVLFRYVLLGAEIQLLQSSKKIQSCILCKMCEDNCPSGVPITENIKTLRNYLSIP